MNTSNTLMMTDTPAPSSPATDAGEIPALIASAEAEVAVKKADGWTQPDFAAALVQELPQPPSLAERLADALKHARRDEAARTLQAQLVEQLLDRARREDDGLLLAAALQLQYSADSQWCNDCAAIADVLAAEQLMGRADFLKASGRILP